MDKRQKRYKRQVAFAKVLFAILILSIIGGILAIIIVIKTTPTTFHMSENYSSEISIPIDEHDTIVFYVTPITIDMDDIELVVENPDVAKCLIQNVYNVAEKRLIKISYSGIAVGETTLYIKDKNSQNISDILHLSVTEKELPPEDNSKTVYLNYGGEKYHYNKNCAGNSAYESTLKQAQQLGKEPCSKCAN